MINKIRNNNLMAIIIKKIKYKKTEIFKTQRNEKLKKCANISKSISRFNFKEVKEDLVGDSCK